MEGMPIVLLTMPGAKTGRTLTRPLGYSRDGDRLVIIASYRGAPRNPSWYHNLIANPVVTVEVGIEKFKARAIPTSGQEQQWLFHAQARLMPFFKRLSEKNQAPDPGTDADANRLTELPPGIEAAAVARRPVQRSISCATIDRLITEVRQ